VESVRVKFDGDLLAALETAAWRFGLSKSHLIEFAIVVAHPGTLAREEGRELRARIERICGRILETGKARGAAISAASRDARALLALLAEGGK